MMDAGEHVATARTTRSGLTREMRAPLPPSPLRATRTDFFLTPRPESSTLGQRSDGLGCVPTRFLLTLNCGRPQPAPKRATEEMRARAIAQRLNKYTNSDGLGS